MVSDQLKSNWINFEIVTSGTTTGLLTLLFFTHCAESSNIATRTFSPTSSAALALELASPRFSRFIITIFALFNP